MRCRTFFKKERHINRAGRRILLILKNLDSTQTVAKFGLPPKKGCAILPELFGSWKYIFNWANFLSCLPLKDQYLSIQIILWQYSEYTYRSDFVEVCLIVRRMSEDLEILPIPKLGAVRELCSIKDFTVCWSGRFYPKQNLITLRQKKIYKVWEFLFLLQLCYAYNNSISLGENWNAESER